MSDCAIHTHVIDSIPSFTLGGYHARHFFMAIQERKLIAERLNNLQPHERRFRANSGSGWTGEILSRKGDILTLKNPRPFHGMPEGTPDLIGWDMITITPEMVGQKVAVFVGEEVKATGDLRKSQKSFRDILVSMGGIFRVIRR